MTDGNGRVRLGVVGLGWWGGVLADAAARCGRAEVVACYARTPATRESFAAEHDCRPAESYAELLAADDVDGVILATPHSGHAEQVCEAAAAGKHVLVDKPFTLDVASGRRAIDAAEAAGVVLMVGHQRRRLPAIRAIKALLDDGRLGTPLLASSVFTVPRGFPANWRADPAESPLGGMCGLGVHTLDTYHYLLGPVARVSATSGAVLAGEPMDHATGLLLEFRSGAVGTLLTSHFTAMAEELSIHASAAVAASRNEGTRLWVQDRHEPDPQEVPLEPVDALAEQVGEFAAAIRGEATPETDGHVGLAVIAVLEAAIAATGRRQAVEIAEFAEP